MEKWIKQNVTKEYNATCCPTILAKVFLEFPMVYIIAINPYF